MEVIHVKLEHLEYPIVIGSNVVGDKVARKSLGEVVRGRRCALISDTTVDALYGDMARIALSDAGAVACSRYAFPAGEASKTLATIQSLYRFGVEEALDRNAVVVALGGGVVGDVAGFFAATFLRGVDFIQMPTTLLALVDSSVGGKVGVDLAEGKNLVGAFHQPRLVLGDLSFLESLSIRELRCGLAEVIKYAVIMDAELFSLLEEEVERMLGLERALYEEVVGRCCHHKAGIVEQDERESGRRELLNYGHTFGHALEVIGGFTAVNHGEAIAIGMGMAVDLAASLGMVPKELPARQDALLEQYGLPLRQPKLGGTVSAETVLGLIYRDKKVRAGIPRLVLPCALGDAVVVECDDRELLLRSIGGRLG